MGEIGDILLALNVRGWQTGCAGGRHEVVYGAQHWQTGQVLLSRAPASHAEDAVRWLLERCTSEIRGSAVLARKGPVRPSLQSQSSRDVGKSPF